MPTNRPLLTRRSFIAFDVESTTGTPLTLDATDATTKVINPTIEPNINMIERDLAGYAAADTSLLGAMGGRATFEIPVVGKGSSGVPEWATRLLPACGWKFTASTAAFDITDETTLTITMWEDGFKRSLAGARGTCSFVFTNGQATMARFEFTGKYLDEADDTIIAPTLATTVPPRWSNTSGLTLDSYALKANTMTINLGSAVQLREDPNDNVSGGNGGTGYCAAALTMARPTFSVDPEMVLVATKDWYNSLVTQGTLALVATVGTAANNIITFTASAAQITSKGRADRNGIAVDNIEGVLTGSSPLSIAFS